MFVQSLAPSLELSVHRIRTIRRKRVAYLLQGVCEARHHLFARHRCAVQIEHEMTEADIWMAEPLDDRLQRRALFRDEEDAAPLGHALRDDVRDCLALASSWWPLHDAVLAFADDHDGAVLRGVRIEDEAIVRRRPFIELRRLDVAHRLGELLP